MSELPTDAIKECISDCRCFDEHSDSAPLELQALLNEIKRLGAVRERLSRELSRG
jgi:hypothetical protein